MEFSIVGSRVMYDIDVIWFLTRDDNTIEIFTLWFSQFNKESQMAFIYLIKNKNIRVFTNRRNECIHPVSCTCNWNHPTIHYYPACSKCFINDYPMLSSVKVSYFKGYEYKSNLIDGEPFELNLNQKLKFCREFTTANTMKTIFYYVECLNKRSFSSALECEFIKQIRSLKLSFIKRILPDLFRDVTRSKYNTINKLWDSELSQLYKFYFNSYKTQSFDPDTMFVIKINVPKRITKLEECLLEYSQSDIEMFLKHLHVYDNYLQYTNDDPTIREKRNTLIELLIHEGFFIQPSYRGDLIQISKSDEYIYVYDQYGIKIKKFTLPIFNNKAFTIICIYNNEKNLLILIDILFWNINLLVYSPTDRYRILQHFYNQIPSDDSIKLDIRMGKNINMISAYNHYKEMVNSTSDDLLYDGIVIKSKISENMYDYSFVDNRYIHINENGDRSLINKIQKIGISIPLFTSNYKVTLVGFSPTKPNTFFNEQDQIISTLDKNCIYFLIFDNYRFVEFIHTKIPENLCFNYTKQIKCDFTIKQNVKLRVSVFRVYFNTFQNNSIEDIVRIEWRPRTSMLNCLRYSL